jgi:hypothetical protein
MSSHDRSAPKRTLDAAVQPAHLLTLCHLLSGALSPHDVPSDDWAALIAEAEVHRVGPLLLWAIAQHGLPLSHDLHEKLRQLNRLAVTRSMVLSKAQQDIARALDEAGIAHIWLKGIVLAATVYPDPALRPMVDLDLLVRPEENPEALECLRQLGYVRDAHTALFDPATLVRQGLIHHHVLRGGPAQSVVIELHYNLLVPRASNFLSPQQERWFYAQAMPYTNGNDQFIGLSTEAHFLYLCAHMVLQHGLEDFALTRLLDLHLLITQRSLNWRALVREAVNLRWTYVLERALQQVKELFDTAIPSGVLEELCAERPSDDSLRRVDALGQPGALFESYKQSVARLPWRKQVAWAWRVAVPDPSYMRWRYSLSAHQWVGPSYARRWSHQLRHLAMWLRSQRELRRLR